MLPLSDLVCICAGSNDNEAWDELVSRAAKPFRLIITRTASKWEVPSRDLIEDLIQTTYVKLWQGGRHLLKEFAIKRPEAVLGYLMRIAANTTHDHFKHRFSQSSGGENWHVSTADFDPETEQGARGSPEDMAFDLLAREIDDHLRQCLSGPDQERDRMVFWLYFRQGMTTSEIASLPGIDLGAKGVGSVIERLKRSIRERILAADS